VRTVVLILTGIAVSAIAAEPQLVSVVRIPQANNQAVVNTAASAVCIPSPSIDPAALWQPLTKMSPSPGLSCERLNRRIELCVS